MVPDSALVERIRSIFLHHGRSVSISAATAMLGWSPNEMRAALAADEITLAAAASGRRIPREELIAKALELWPLEYIEHALGHAAGNLLPPALRTRRISAHIRDYQFAMLSHLSTRRNTTLNHILTYQLDTLATEHLDELSALVPGFAEAFHWPYGD